MTVKLSMGAHRDPSCSGSTLQVSPRTSQLSRATMSLKRVALAVVSGDEAVGKRRQGRHRRKATREAVDRTQLPWQLGDRQQFNKVKAIMQQAALDDPILTGKEKQVIGHVIASLNPDKPWAYP